MRKEAAHNGYRYARIDPVRHVRAPSDHEGPRVLLPRIAATVCLIILGYPLTVISQKIFTALNSFSIMAIPLFILGGNLMSEGGISKRLTEFCEALVGNIRGGLAIVVILACAFFAACPAPARRRSLPSAA